MDSFNICIFYLLSNSIHRRDYYGSRRDPCPVRDDSEYRFDSFWVTNKGTCHAHCWWPCRNQKYHTCNCTDQSKRGYVEYAEVQCAGKRGSVSNATDAHQEDSGSDFEVNLKVFAVLRLYLIYCASLLRIILCVISARTLKNGGFCFKSGARQRGKSSFSLKRMWWPISFSLFLKLSNNFPSVE